MKLIRRSSITVTHDNSHLKRAGVDDELSVSSEHSTFSVVGDASTKKQLPVVNSHHCRRRQVQFDESHNVYHANTQMDKDECQQLWYSGTDMRHFKSQTTGIAREIYRAERANTAAFSYSRVVLAAYDSCCRMPCETEASPLSSLEQKNLNKWMQVGVSRTGLERVCIREIATDRSTRRSHVVDVVLDAQESLVFREDIDEILRKTAETVSRPSRLFAREVAKAQAAASL